MSQKIKTRPIDVMASAYFDFGAENDDKDPKFDVGDHVRVPKYKKIFAKSQTLN